MCIRDRSYGAEDGLPFAQEVVSSKMSDDGLEMQVKVTNNGTAAGKNVVEPVSYTHLAVNRAPDMKLRGGKVDVLPL